MRTVTLFLAALLCLPMGGCGLLVGHFIRDNERKHEAQMQVDASLAHYQNLAFEQNADRLADLYEADGELSHDADPPIRGRDHIRSYLEKFSDQDVREYRIKAASTQVEDKGEVRQHGTYAQVVKAPDGSVRHSAGDFDATWRQQPDGSWLLARMHTTSSAPAAAGS